MKQVEASKMMAYRLHHPPKPTLNKSKTKSKPSKVKQLTPMVEQAENEEKVLLLNQLKKSLVKVPPPIQDLPIWTPTSQHGLTNGVTTTTSGDGGYNGNLSAIKQKSEIISSEIKKTKGRKKKKYFEVDLKIPCPCSTCDLTFPNYSIM